MSTEKSKIFNLRLPTDDADWVLVMASEYGLTMSQVIRRCIRITMGVGFHIGLPNNVPATQTITTSAIPQKDELDVGAIIMSGMNKQKQQQTTFEDEISSEDDGTLNSQEDKHSLESQEDNGIPEDVPSSEDEGTSDSPNTIKLVDVYSPDRPPFELIPIADFNQIPEDNISETLRNLRRFSPELQDYGTKESQESVQSRLNPTHRIVDETSSSYVEDALPIPSTRIVSRELLFFPAEIVETPNWPMQMPNILIGRLHPLNERDRIDALIDTGRIAEFFPQKIVEQIKKYDDKVMPRKLFESRIARQLKRRDEDKKQKEDEEFQSQLEQKLDAWLTAKTDTTLNNWWLWDDETF